MKEVSETVVNIMGGAKDPARKINPKIKTVIVGIVCLVLGLLAGMIISYKIIQGNVNILFVPVIEVASGETTDNDLTKMDALKVLRFLEKKGVLPVLSLRNREKIKSALADSN